MPGDVFLLNLEPLRCSIVFFILTVCMNRSGHIELLFHPSTERNGLRELLVAILFVKHD